MSASDPGAIAPFFGYIPNILAAFADVMSTNRSRLIPSSTTPTEYAIPIRVSIPLCPPVTSATVLNRVFSSHVVDTRSVATVEIRPSRSPCHSDERSSSDFSDG